jgi:DNA-binding NtrC family response regulator
MSEPAVRVLVVEDDAVSHCIVASSLRRRGFDVVPAKCAEEAIVILRNDHDIAVVFSDVVMPGEIDGWGLQHWIDVNRPGLPVILGSADPAKAQPHSRAEFRFFAKPYNVDAIAACIRSLVR